MLLATCHCGAVQIEIDLPDGIEKPTRCNCSFCRRRGAIMAFVELDKLKVVKGENFLSTYQFGTFTAKHYFCSNCGIYTHHQRRSNPNQFAFNIGCIDEIDVLKFENVGLFDGKKHPSDK